VNIYVGNLSRETTEETLRQAFAGHGEVSSSKITKAEAQSAISNLNGTELDGRLLKVNEARPRNDNRSGGGSWSGGRRSW
jgi:RNA recognition motif-containing protein